MVTAQDVNILLPNMTLMPRSSSRGRVATEVHTFDPEGDVVFHLQRTFPDDDESISQDEGQHVAAVDNENEARRIIHVDLVVSSRHMTLASPVFKAMLHSGGFQEGHTLHTEGRVGIAVEDDDPDAFIILLNTIHGHNRKVPRQIDLDTMTQLTILVDKYQMVEAAEAFTEAWIEDLKMEIPTSYDEDEHKVHQWIVIAWVFGARKEFRDMTRLVERGCWSNLADRIDEHLPIPDIIVSTIQSQRDEAIESLFSPIAETLERYTTMELLCPRTDGNERRKACDAMLLGSLLRSGIDSELDYSADNVSYNDIKVNMLALDVESLCDTILPDENIGAPIDSGDSSSHVLKAHGLHRKIADKVSEADAQIDGLDYSDFKKLTARF